MAPTPETLSFERRIAQADSDWRKAAVSARAYSDHRKKSYRTARREELAVGYRIGEIICDDDFEWAAFQEEKIWNGRPLDRENALRYGIQYVAGEAKGPLAELASSYANALETAFVSTPPVPASDIPAYIEENGGINALLQAYRDRKKASQASRGEDGTTDKVKAKGNPVAEHVDVSTADLPEDALQIDGVSGVLPADTTSNNESEPDSSATPATGPARTKRYADTLKGKFRFEVVLSEKDGLAATNKSLAGDFLIRCRHVPNGDLTWVRVDGKLEL